MTLYRFSASTGWLSHLWKSTVLRPHEAWRPILRGIVPADGTIIDVGAHGGQFTRLLSSIVPRGMVIAVEPSGYTRSILRPVLWLRRIENVVVFSAALGAESGTVMLHTPIKRYGDMGYGLANVGGTATAGSVSEPVPITTLDAVVGALGLTALHFIKADIEGHEAAMVAGARATLRRFRPVVLLEQDPNFLARSGSSIGALSAEMRSLGYQPHRRSPDGSSHRPAPESELLEGDVLWMPDTR